MRIAALYLVALSSLSAAAAPAPASNPAGLSVSAAWVRANAPGSDVAAAYFDLRNAGRRPATLTGISTPGAGHASVHITVIANGISSMREQGVVQLLAGETVKFQPGGMHVMLSAVKGQLHPGGTLPLTLDFADGTRVRINAAIKPLAGP